MFFDTYRSGFLAGLATIFVYQTLTPSPMSFFVGMIVGISLSAYVLGSGYVGLCENIARSLSNSNNLGQLVTTGQEMFRKYVQAALDQNAPRNQAQNPPRGRLRRPQQDDSDDDIDPIVTPGRVQSPPPKPQPVDGSPTFARSDHVHHIGTVDSLHAAQPPGIQTSHA